MDVTSREFQKEIGKHIDIAAAGEPVIISRHGRQSVAIVPIEQWQRWSFDDPRWRSILNRMGTKWPKRKDDYQLITDLLLHWEIDQDSGNSKSAKMDKIYDLLLWVAKKLGYVEVPNV
jgi:prevent-host-death family protein